MNMKGEKMRTLVNEGWHDFEIVKIKEETSKAGNQMFIASVALADNPQQGLDVYLVAEEGKRWFLKQLLIACGIEPDVEDNFSWDIPDVEGKTVQGRIEHVNEEWIDREGKTRNTPKAKLVEFKRLVIR